MTAKGRHTDELLRYLEGALDASEETAMRDRLGRSPALRDELERLSSMRASMQDAVEQDAEAVLKPFFTDRTMRRLNQAIEQQRPVEEDLAFMLARIFRPVALAGFVLAVCLAVYNVHLSRDYSTDTTTAEAVLALPPITAMSVYDLDLYEAEASSLP